MRLDDGADVVAVVVAFDGDVLTDPEAAVEGAVTDDAAAGLAGVVHESAFRGCDG